MTDPIDTQAVALFRYGLIAEFLHRPIMQFSADAAQEAFVHCRGVGCCALNAFPQFSILG